MLRNFPDCEGFTIVPRIESQPQLPRRVVPNVLEYPQDLLARRVCDVQSQERPG
jgi:hypothetical protein